MAAEPAERRRVVIMGAGAADAEGVERLRDAEEAGGGVLVGLLARGRKGTLRFGVVLGLGFALEADEGAGRLFAGDAGAILEALAEPPGGTNLRGSMYVASAGAYSSKYASCSHVSTQRERKKIRGCGNATRNRFCVCSSVDNKLVEETYIPRQPQRQQ